MQMPTESSATREVAARSTCNLSEPKKCSYWPKEQVNINHCGLTKRKLTPSIGVLSVSSTFEPLRQQNPMQSRHNTIKTFVRSSSPAQPEPSDSLASEFIFPNRELSESTISLDGRKLVVASSRQPHSMESISSHPLHADSQNSRITHKVVTSKTASGYLLSNQQYTKHLQMSQSSLHAPTTASSSTAQLHTLSAANQRSSMTIKCNVNLKYIKTAIICLLAIDLLITIFVHQFAVRDRISIWFTAYELRFSLLNLLLSAIWFIILVGAILFDVYYILLISCVIEVASFFVLFGFTVYHFTRRIDYNTVNIASLLALLFSIIFLHAYLVLTASLTIHLTLAVRRRQTNSRTNL